MKLLQASSAALVGMALCSVVYAYQRTADFGFSDDAETNVKAEFYWSRLSYTPAVGSSFAGGYGGYGGYGGWHSWSRDYPKADRQVLLSMKRLTRIQTRSTEQVVDLDSDKIFDYPWVYAVQVQTWSFTDEEAKRLREHLRDAPCNARALQADNAKRFYTQFRWTQRCLSDEISVYRELLYHGSL